MSRAPGVVETRPDFRPVTIYTFCGNSHDERNQYLSLGRVLPDFLDKFSGSCRCVRTQTTRYDSSVRQHHAAGEQPPQAVFQRQFALNHEMSDVMRQPDRSVEALYLQHDPVITVHDHLIFPSCSLGECNLHKRVTNITPRFRGGETTALCAKLSIRGNLISPLQHASCVTRSNGTVGATLSH